MVTTLRDTEETRDQESLVEQHRELGSGPAWVKGLAHHYGWDLLFLLIAAQHVLKGFVQAYIFTAMDFVFREYGIAGPTIQVYKAVALLPWGLKPVVGICSDAIPILGLRKAPYIVMATMVGGSALAVVGWAPDSALDVKVCVMCFFFAFLQISVCDLLTEAKYAEKMREKPQYGPDLMTFVWGGITIGSLCAMGTVGLVIEHLGTRVPFAIATFPALFVLVPTLFGGLQEPWQSAEDTARERERFSREPELVFLAVMMGVLTIGLAFLGIMQSSVLLNVVCAVVVGLIILLAFTLLTTPRIGRMNAFFFVQTAMAFSIEGGTFYFFTDNEKQYPEGPHFSIVFYTTGLGLVAGVCNLIGLWTYNRHMKSWRYHSLFILANLLWCGLNCCGLLVYTRFNLVLGIPDHVFVLGGAVLQSVVHQWMWMPGVVLLSQLCPKGLEATMYALLAGCHNIGHSVAQYIGAYVLQSLEVTPRGADNESHVFDNLWIAALLQALLPVITLIALPAMIPNALQTDVLLAEGQTATHNSPYSRFKAWLKGVEIEDFPVAEKTSAATKHCCCDSPRSCAPAPGEKCANCDLHFPPDMYGTF